MASRFWIGGIVLTLGIACGGDDSPGNDGGTTGSSGVASLTTAATESTTAGTTSGATGGGGSSDTAVGTGGSVDCGGQIFACSDGMDNDGDGLIDAADPECTGACDDDEASFQTGIPGDNMDCWQDCFFDGNSGHGDDGCRWNLRCDPEDPGAGSNCAFSGGGNCDSMPPDTPDECIDFCSGLTPNGCDCFGCCIVETPQGPVSVFLNSGPDCSLTNLDACNSCTFNQECNNPCDPMSCEICFGGELPPGCDEPECPEGQQPCTTDGEGGSTCAEGQFCLTGCCIDFVPPS